jgi:PhoH-like ATPase
MQGNDFYAHINLQKGERSELANIASKLLYAADLH